MVLPLFALLLPVLLAMGALVVDGGGYYTRYAQMEHLARVSADSVLTQVGIDFVSIAETKYYADCFVEDPPSRCYGTLDWRNFITGSQVDQYVLNAVEKSNGRARGEDFAVEYDPKSSLELSDITVEYPLEYNPGDGVIRARVTIESKPEIWLKNFNIHDPIRVEGIARLPLW